MSQFSNHIAPDLEPLLGSGYDAWRLQGPPDEPAIDPDTGLTVEEELEYQAWSRHLWSAEEHTDYQAWLAEVNAQCPPEDFDLCPSGGHAIGTCGCGETERRAS